MASSDMDSVHSDSDDDDDAASYALHMPQAAPDVYHGIYVAGSKPMSDTERDLRYEFFSLRIYLIRSVNLEGLAMPDCRVEALALSMISTGQAPWHQLQRLTSLLPCDARLRWPQSSRHGMNQLHRVMTGAYNRGPMAGLHRISTLFPWSSRVCVHDEFERCGYSTQGSIQPLIVLQLVSSML